MNNFHFSSMQSLAHDLRAACLQDTKIDLTSRPWNRYDPRHGPWYLLSTTEWPAYPYPKLSIRMDERSGDVFFSLYVEKGFLPVAATVNLRLKDRGLILERGWYWHSYLGKVVTEEYLRAIGKISSAYGEALMLKISGTYTTGMEILDEGNWPYDNLDAYYADHSAGRLWFALNKNGEIECQETRNLQAEMDEAAGMTTLTGLAGWLRSSPRLSWVWVDFEVGVLLTPESSPTAGQWIASEIWRGLLSPWMPWLNRV